MDRHSKKSLIYFTILVIISLLSVAYKPISFSATDLVKSQLVSDLKEFIRSCNDFHLHVKQSIDSNDKKASFKKDFIKARLAFKKIEFLAEYYTPSTSKMLNSPFLEKADEEEPTKEPKKPEGFQAIENILYAEDTIALYQLEILTSRLKFNAERLFPLLITYQLTDENVWWAMRLQIIRIMSLGITGFDSPIAKLSIIEATQSIKSLRMYYKCSVKDTTLKIWEETDLLFTKTENYICKNQKFEAFDRLYFITNFLNPLFEKLLETQRKLAIGYLDEATAIKQDATNIFTKTAWNPYFFQSYKSNGESNQKLRAELGKLLFFDPILSSNEKRSCASCHNPNQGFAENKAKSMALDGKSEIKRNAPTILNAALQAKLFADSRLNFLEDQIQDVVFAPSELHGNFNEIAKKLKESEEYRLLFAKAYEGTTEAEINAYAIIKSLAAYERTLLSLNSRFDQYVNGNKKALNSAEIRGFNIFAGKGLCATCHFIPLFNGTVPPMYFEGELEVLGVPNLPNSKIIDEDKGRGDVTAISWQNHAFKTPSVRNIALTAPYMHNGVYKTLEEIVDFYNKGGGQGLGIDVQNQTLPFDNLQLSKKEQTDLVAFMNALTDTVGLTSKPLKLPEIKGITRKVGGEY
jgi:cytochrome c peroxidase